jgi:hypothetical protein
MNIKDKLDVDLTLKTIANKIENVDINNVGLYSGIASRVLFFIHLQMYFNNNVFYNRIIDKLTKDLFFALGNNPEMNSSMGSGFTGIGWLFNYLNRYFPHLNPHFELAGLNKYVIQSLKFDFNIGNYDPLHGYIAKGNYLLTLLPNREAKKAIFSILDHLFNIIEQSTNFISWKAIKKRGRYNIAYDLGIPHGMSGILIFLMKVYEKGIFQIKIKDIANRAINWIGCIPNCRF